MHLEDLKKHPGWEEAKQILTDCIDEEYNLIAYTGVDDNIVGQEYKAMRKAKNIVRRAIARIEGAKNFGTKPRIIR